MKEIFISDIKAGDQITDFFMVKSIALKIGSNNKQYLDITLGDSAGEISAKKWDVADEELPKLEEIKVKDIVKVKAQVTEWNGMKQFRINRIRKSVKEDQLQLRDFIKAAPEEPQEMWDYIYSEASAIADSDLRTIATRLMEENKERLMYYPAAQKNHHAEYAGLLYHMRRMLTSGKKLCEVYTNLDCDLVITGVILHDIEKLNEIESDTLGISSGYSFEGKLLGHLVQGVKLIDRMAREIGMSEEKAIMLEHMVLAHHYEPEFGSPKRPMFPEAELLHYLDVMDAKLFDMEEALEKVDEGEFSERVWTLDNRTVYKSRKDK